MQNQRLLCTLVVRDYERKGMMSEALLAVLCLLGIVITVVVLSALVAASRADRALDDE